MVSISSELHLSKIVVFRIETLAEWLAIEYLLLKNPKKNFEHEKAASRQPSQNAGVPSNPLLSICNASEQEDVSFGQDIQRVQQLLTERAIQVSLF
ncbi:unnamed protein product [Caenorhabditis angaria]|uniref:Uncharacterized protein n=1 Tax=Caenorhabditis angaria TaxID=860376 RepID=A0A9P1N4K2_9PELO|nr:unnamed protein product [Caenorhabditis angaria]